MKKVRLLRLGMVPPVRSQTCYHAAAYALGDDSPDTIILVSPSDPYVCIGFHQDLEKEVDEEYCRGRGLPVYRREVGGGAVYLDRDQLFVQWIFHPSSLPADVAGVGARHRPVNDVHVGPKKIGGTGAARIGRAEVVVGSLMFDFDRAAMARVLRVASEKMRDKVLQSLEEYMTTLRDELGAPPDRPAVEALYLAQCARVLDAEVVPGEWTAGEEIRARELDRRFESRDWLDQKGATKRPGVKIHEDVQVCESSLKAPGGLIRLTLRLRNNCIDDLSISGDFTILPRTAIGGIEEALRGVAAEPQAILEVIRARYRESAIQSPGIGPDDWAAAFSLALKS
jgi:lipoate---protein ligase